MSFLNPVNEPVLRFKSTDAGAPQINYNSRVAGDVKAVLKACLVTGYGTKESAGWSIANEVGHVAEFVSPSAAMSDYRLGIDDSTTTKTDWYYQYQDAQVLFSYRSPVKLFQFTDNAHPGNGWILFVTERGILFIELVQSTAVNKLSPRITYWGKIKSARSEVGGKNIMFFNIGHNGAIAMPAYFYNSDAYIHVAIDDQTKAFTSSLTTNALSSSMVEFGLSNVDLISPIYLTTSLKGATLGEFPAMLSKTISNIGDMYDINDSEIGGRNVMSVCAGYADTLASRAPTYSRAFLVKTDYWEY